MGTLTEEIFSNKLGRAVEQDETVVVDADRVMSHDTTTPLAIQAFRKLTQGEGSSSGRVFDARRSHIVFDHIIPAATIAAATLHRDIRTFAQEQDIRILQEGICHQVMPERGYVIPGDIIVGADSHTCTYGALGAFASGMGSTDIGVAYATGRTWFRIPRTINIRLLGRLPFGVYAKDVTFEIVRQVGVDGANYRAIEYSGELIEEMSVSERFTFCNMAIEMGGKAGLVAPDATTQAWLHGRTDRAYPMLAPHNPRYERVIEIDASQLQPTIACPREIYLEAMRLGYLEIFVQAGASVGTPGCGPCIGRHHGVLAPGERALTTMNRNFTGRMGDPTSEIYLGSPAKVAATALTGHITDPRNFL